MKNCLAFVVCVMVVSARTYWHRSRNADPVTPEWDKLSETWLKWDEIPLTVSDAVAKGWGLRDKCQARAYFQGHRYIRDGDLTLMLLFDANDKIAGIQTGIAKSIVEPMGLPWRQEDDSYVVTAYFKDPSLICSDKHNSKAKYIGDRLLIQNSSKSNGFVRVPLLERGLLGGVWTEGECFWTMGKLYWYDLPNVSDCNSLLPVFLMYTNGVLNGFGWILPYKVDNPRFVHPTNVSFPYLFKGGTIPACFWTADHLSMMHLYLDSNPFFNIC
ncbi:uncharacterized protein LOC111323023 [Stylophora pistillata]|uniref:uncharacterized protein LOC111323023 n=1 Tax=Stylophora pistillata TaxID=50429 RepID=UPI000C0578FB|nr:uncharacterized protein LOC111323023 [Stylophora pistillata]